MRPLPSPRLPLLLLAALATVAAPFASASDLAAEASTATLTLPGSITIFRDMDTGFFTYLSPLSSCSDTSGPAGVRVSCSLGSVAGVPRQCTKAATIHAVVASVSRAVYADAWCGSSGYAGCFTDPLGVNVGACQGNVPPLYWLLDTVATGRPWWYDMTPSGQVSCGTWEYEPFIGVTGVPKGSYTVTCTFA